VAGALSGDRTVVHARRRRRTAPLS